MQQLQAIYDMMQKQIEEAQTVSISSIKTDTWLHVQSKAQLSIRIVKDLPASAIREKVDAYGWDDRNERSQSDGCDYWFCLPCCATFSLIHDSHIFGHICAYSSLRQ